MAGKTERQKINLAREKYARQYAGKLKEKDAVIDRLRKENDELKSKIADLESGHEADRAEIARLEKLAADLAGKAGMTPEDLQALRADMAARAKGAAAMAQLVGMTRAMGGLYGI